MKVCLAGHFGGSLDEGVRNVGKSLATGLDRTGIELEKLEISSFLEWKSIKAFRPDIIHFVLTPTTAGVITAKLISSLFPEAKTVISAVHPSVSRSRVLKQFKPDLILTQAKESEDLFRSIGFNTRFFPNGVDINKFKPIPRESRQRLRDQLQISESSFVVLHLASMRRERNLDIFKTIQKEGGHQVIIVGREHEDTGRRLQRELQEAGCLVWKTHFANIEDIYNVSDCYVFPTFQKKACIETPLSVLEAMACNLPVVTTRFGTLPRMFAEGSGFFFAEKEEHVLEILGGIKNRGTKVETRRMVLPHSWDSLSKDLAEIYEGLLQ